MSCLGGGTAALLVSLLVVEPDGAGADGERLERGLVVVVSPTCRPVDEGCGLVGVAEEVRGGEDGVFGVVVDVALIGMFAGEGAPSKFQRNGELATLPRCECVGGEDVDGRFIGVGAG